MTRHARCIEPASILALAWLVVFARHTRAELTPDPVIHQDQAWSGQITITRTVRIIGATVRVEAGSTIRFASASGGPAAIELVGEDLTSARSRPASLRLEGTADKPVTVETPSSQPPGRITASPRAGASIVAHHTVFRRLGQPRSAHRAEPALSLALNSERNDLWLADCRFEDCGPVHAEFIGTGATADIRRCTFERTVGPASLELIGTGTGIRVVCDNVADAAFHVECGQLLLADNVLIGPSAAIDASSPTAENVTIRQNYVHCTTTRDEGRYATHAAGLDIRLVDNVLIGGTYVIERAPRSVIGNILIGVAGLEPSFTGTGLQITDATRETTTHYLLTNLAPDAEVSDNLFLGPAYAAVALDRASTRPYIHHNLFDGWNQARRAIDFNPLRLSAPSEALQARVTHNVFTRYSASPIVDSTRRKGTLSVCESNLLTAPIDRDDDVPADMPEDSSSIRAVGGFEELKLNRAASTQTTLELDERVRRREITVERLRQMWISAYTPAPDSPMLLHPEPVGPRFLTEPAQQEN